MSGKYKIDRAFLRRLECTGKYQEYSDTELRGFAVRVTPAGCVSYVIRWVKPSRQHGRRVIGHFPQMNPSEARALAIAELRNVDKLADTAAEILERKRRLAEVTQLRSEGETLGGYIDGNYSRQISIKYKSADKTIKRLKACFKDFLGKPLMEFTRADIENWRYQRLKRGLKPATLEREINGLKGVFSRAVKDGLLTQSPLGGLEPLSIAGSHRVRWLSRDEEKRLRQALDERQRRDRSGRDSGNEWRRQRNIEPLPDMSGLAYTDHLKPMVLLSLNTGLRQGELLSLEWTMVDLERKFLTVTAVNSKTSRERHVPINDEAFDVLTHWRQQSPKRARYVFEGEEGRPMTSLKTAWTRLLADAGIQDFTWHDMRHHFASVLVMGGVDLNTVRELLGHSDIKMTLRYAHLEPEHKAAAVAVLCKRG